MADPPLHENAKQILRIISRIEGEVSTRKITSQSGIKNDLVNYHIGRLKEHGYVEQVGTDDKGNAPIPANTYDVTQEGERRAQELRMELNEEPDVGGDESHRIGELEETVGYLKRQNNKQHDRISGLEQQVEKHRKAIKKLIGDS